MAHMVHICIWVGCFRCLTCRKGLKLTKNPILACFENVTCEIMDAKCSKFNSAYLGRNLTDLKTVKIEHYFEVSAFKLA